MAAMENALLVLLFILTVSLVLPEIFRKFRLPLITLVILAGAVTGPYGLDYVQQNEVIDFFGFLGMAFLMLIAGLETNISQLVHSKFKIMKMAFINGFVPFLVGVVITSAFGYPLLTSVLVGIVFISSSVAVIVPSLRENKLIHHNIAQLILVAVMVADIVSLVALGAIFQNTEQITSLPLPIYYLILFASIAALFYIVIPRLSDYALRKALANDKDYEEQLRFVMIIMIAVLAYFSFLGVHPLLAAFLSGLSLSRVVMREKSGILYTKIHTLGYGLFIPVFFFIVGMEMDLSLFSHFSSANILMLLLIFGLILSKFGSGYAAGRVVRLSRKNSILFGSISITQLTTTLAVTYAAASLGLLDSVLVTTIILIAIITTILGPILTSYLSTKDLDRMMRHRRRK